ncbi:unnamed protein product, partial [Linum tenue]
WYDFVCFGIVAAAFMGSLWTLWTKEGIPTTDSPSSPSPDFHQANDFDSDYYESLLEGVDRARDNKFMITNLWSCCWKGGHSRSRLFTLRFVRNNFLLKLSSLYYNTIQ